MFHFLHGSSDSRICGDVSEAGRLGDDLAIAMTADSKFLSRAFMSGSGSPLCVHLRSECDVTKQSSHLLALDARPEKFMANKVALIVDNLLFPVSAACCLKAASYLTQPRPS